MEPSPSIPDELVEEDTGSITFAESEPAIDEAGSDTLAGQREPTMKTFVFREEFHQGTVRDGDVLGVARSRRPAERSSAEAELRSNVGRHESWKSKALANPLSRARWRMLFP